MEAARYGQLFRDLRVKRGITQLQLSEGICSERQIKNIESGRNLPTLPMLSKLEDKLGQQVFELAILAELKMDNEGYLIYLALEDAYQQHDFVKLRALIKEHREKMIGYVSTVIRQKVLWYEAICFGALDKDYERCQMKLEEAWSLSYPGEDIAIEGKYLTRIELQIYNSTASNEYVHHNHWKAIELYKELYKYFKRHQIQSLKRMFPLTCYNLLKSYNALDKYEDGIPFGHEVVAYCKQNQSMELLAETYFELGMAIYKLGEKDIAIPYFKKGFVLAMIFGKREDIMKRLETMEHRYGFHLDRDLL